MNYLWDERFHLFRRATVNEFAYSDGTEVEARLLGVVSRAKDRGTFSPELAAAIDDWPSEYHLSRARHCLVRPLGVRPGDKVLELGCGCGAVTRYLGEIGANVVAVEGSLARARVAAERSRDLGNVRVVVDDLLRFETEEMFDWVFLIGVLEYAAMFSASENPFEHYLRSVSRFRAPLGRVVVAIENKLGLKYFNGCGEDHVGTPYFGIQDLYGPRTPRTFGRKELVAQLAAAGLPNAYFYYPFPDYKLPSVVLAEDALRDPDFDPIDLIARSHGRDYLGSPYRSFDEALAFAAVGENGLLADLSNSFLVVATPGATPAMHAGQLAMAFSYYRAPQFTTQTRFVRNGSTIQVLKEHLVSSVGERSIHAEGMTIHNHLVDSCYQPGRQIIWRLLRARARSGELEPVVEALQPWMEFLAQHARVATGDIADLTGQLPSLASYSLPGDFLDCTPFNLLQSGEALTSIDVEWRADRDVPLGWVVTRGVLWSLTAGMPVADRLQSATAVIAALCQKCGFAVSDSDLQLWLKLEAEFQTAATGRPHYGLSLDKTSSGMRLVVAEIADLKEAVSAREGQIAGLSLTVAGRDEEIVRYAQTVAAKTEQIVAKDEQIVASHEQVAARDEQIAAKDEQIVAKEQQIANLNQDAAARESQIATLNDVLAGRAEHIAGLDREVARRNEQIEQNQAHIAALQRRLIDAHAKLASFSWRVTRPLRGLRSAFPRTVKILQKGAKIGYWTLTLQLPRRRQQRQVARMLLESGLFDAEFYLTQYPDVADAGVNPLAHYLSEGVAEGRKPNLYFDTTCYLQQNPDVAESGINPLLHYLTHGFKEAREPGPEFSGRLYLEQNPDVAASGMNPLGHFLSFGIAEGRRVPVPQPLAVPEEPNVIGEVASVPGDPYSRGESILLAHDGVNRILVIDLAVPTPDMDSGSVRMFGLLRLLVGLGSPVTLASDRLENNATHIEAVKKLGVNVLVGHTEIHAHLEQWGGGYALAILSRPETAAGYLSLVRAYAPYAEVVYDSVDLHHLRFRRAAELKNDPEQARRAELYFQLETLGFTFADRVLAITETEKQAILRDWPEAVVEVVPNVHSVRISPMPWAVRKGLTFIGGYDHEPNVDAVVWFVQEVFPKVLGHIPDVRFTILGSRPPESVRQLASTNVNVVGWVPDPEPYFEACRIFVAPLRYGAGMKGKVGQAMSLGLPVVTTHIGAEGMRLADGVHALIADDAEAFAGAVIRLYNDEALWTSLQQAAAAHILRNYSDTAVEEILRRLFANEAVSARAASEVTA